MKKLDFGKIEKKWKNKWSKDRVFLVENKSLYLKKKYILDMFPYPSGEGLHVGHVEGYTASDIVTRYYRAKGFRVLHPMGWDAFGLPAENYAIKKQISPEVVVKNNVANFKKQIDNLGLSYDWSREINTTDPNYYKWTQWIFLQMFKGGLAYKKEVPVNWCPSCKTVLADEEVVAGTCDRCHSKVERKEISQWMLKITDYADRLLKDLEQLDWPTKVKIMQKNWIGKSEGAVIKFKIGSRKEKIGLDIDVFTTRPDTIFGATYLVVAPENKIISQIKKLAENYREVEKYIASARNKSDEERISNKEKTGVKLENVYALNPATQKEIPIFIADYVLSNYGTGSIMGVPAHDQRDFDFAKRYNLEIKEVVMAENKREESKEENESEKLFTGEGILINSDKFNGKRSEKIRDEIIKFVGGKKEIQYRLRDWVFSRQRYWGEPFPIVFCQRCLEKIKSDGKLTKAGNLTKGEIINPGWVPLEEKDLPLKLPKVKNYQPTGTLDSPLAGIESWVKTKCPRCGGEARRETNTMPQWAGSCWYYLRYLEPKNKKELVSKEADKKIMPVDIYIGGVEHAVLHLLYARFWHKFLYDIGAVSTKEPFQKLINQGLILGEDGEKMSKSRGNVINPDEVIKRFGADSLRMYEMFMGPLEDAKPWNENGIVGLHRFLSKVWQIASEFGKNKNSAKTDAELEKNLHKTIKKVTEDIERFGFNTAISSMMVFVNLLSGDYNLKKDDFEKFILILSPFAPFVCEEIWEALGHRKSISLEKWPDYDKKIIIDDLVKLAVQFNGKTRGAVEIKKGVDKEYVLNVVKKDETVGKYLVGDIKKVIFVPDRIINIIL